MITIETARRLLNCHIEIARCECFIKEIQEKIERIDSGEPQEMRDSFGNCHTITICSSVNDYDRLYNPNPHLLLILVLKHKEEKEIELAKANEQAQIEISELEI